MIVSICLLLLWAHTCNAVKIGSTIEVNFADSSRSYMVAMIPLITIDALSMHGGEGKSTTMGLIGCQNNPLYRPTPALQPKA